MKKLSFLFSICLLTIVACVKDDEVDQGPVDDGDLTDIPYDPQSYELVVPASFGVMEIPADNPLTVDGVQLGRHLFYDPILSADSTMSCSSCHLPSGSFTDNLAVSTGIDGIDGTRSSMSLLNVGYYYNGLFWDGRAATLEEQALMPVEDPVELHNTWPNVVSKLKAHSSYPDMFRKAFGIENTSQITKELAAKAIAQFERIMVSSGQSKYDLVEAATPGWVYSDDEVLGKDLFFNEEANHPGCSHCHDGVLFTTNEYENNALDSFPTLDDYIDKGQGPVSGDPFDNGKFRIPTLRNIDLTGPYMHDGRFDSLEQVIDHYSSGGFGAENVPSFLLPFDITEEEKMQLIAFLKTLTDLEFVNNPDLQNPF